MEQESVQSTISTRLELPWLFPVRVLWLAASLMALGLFIAGLPLRAQEIGALYRGDIQSTLTQNQAGEIVLSPWHRLTATQAGVLQGDILLAVDGVEVTSMKQANALLGGEIGTPVTVLVQTGDFPPRALTITRQSQAGSILLAYGLSSQFAFFFVLISEILLTILCMGIASIIFWYRSDDRMALLSALMVTAVLVGLSLPVVEDLGSHIHTGTNPYWLDVWYVLVFSLLTLFFYLFPAGRFNSTVTTGLAILLGLWMGLGLLDRSLLLWNLPRSLFISVGTFWITTGIAALIYRYRRSDVFQRQQIRWTVWGAVASAIGLLLQIFPTLFDLNGSTRVTYDFLLYPLGQILKACLPLSIAFAILRYRLWNIDLILNRVLVYGSLSVLTMLGYLATLFVFHVVFTGLSNPVISFVATGLVAILFEPLRQRLQRAVNRWMYGERDDPYAVLSRLVQTLESTLSTNEILPSLAETIGHSLKIPYVAIWLDEDAKERLVATSGKETTDLVSLPLVYQGETIGRLEIARRAPGEEFSDADLRLIENIAQQAGAAAQTVRLHAELIRSRAQIVSEREDERLRIRRDLHDELGPLLASQGLKLAAARQMIRGKPERAEAVLDDVIQQSQQTVTDVRRLVHGLRPPALDQLGLVEAIRDLARNQSTGLAMEVSIPADGLPKLPAAVEVSAYRIVLEAWNNASKHAQANCFTVQFQVKQDMLVITIEDDGVGMPKEFRAGVGLRSMRARAQEIGGKLRVEPAQPRGTSIIAKLPLFSREG
jgi:signal transduction histidine kinase